MSRELPILFNTEMVKAILDGRKMATRRLIKFPRNNYTGELPKAGNVKVYKNTYSSKKVSFLEEPHYTFDISPPCHFGDILYVRETWNFVYEMDGNDQPMEETGHYVYHADDMMPFTHWIDPVTGEHKDHMPWHPSIHMPKEAARIWLKVKNVRVERLQDMTLDDFLNEGTAVPYEAFNDPDNAYMQAKSLFAELWDSTIKKSGTGLYGWEANPWVWVLEFERCEKPEEYGGEGK